VPDNFSGFSAAYAKPVFTAYKMSPADFNEALGSIMESLLPKPYTLDPWLVL